LELRRVVLKRKSIIISVSILFNIVIARYILEKDVTIIFKDQLVCYQKEADIDYNVINRESVWVNDEDMAVRLVEAYLGDRLNYGEVSNPLFTTIVSFDEEKYEYLVQITIEQREGIYAGKEEQFIVGIRKDYGIVTYYD